MRQLFASLLIALLPSLGLAQSVALPLQPPAIDTVALHAFNEQALIDQMLTLPPGTAAAGQTQIMPLWSTPDGRILAMVGFANSGGAPSLPQSPQIGTAADWQLVDVTNFISGGLVLRLNDKLLAHSSLKQGVTSIPLYTSTSTWCMQANSLDASCAGHATLAHSGELNLGTNWAVTDDVDFDFNYGLSWLRRDQAATAGGMHSNWDLLSGIGNPAMPTLVIPGIAYSQMQNPSLSAFGRWHVNDTQSVDLGATLSRIEFSSPGNASLVNANFSSLNQAALSVGLRYGSFSGLLIGRVLGPADVLNSNSQRWAGVDLGISWHTPWQGELSVGAQNMWSSGSLPTLIEPASAHETDPNQARVPYVQYHQDL